MKVVLAEKATEQVQDIDAWWRANRCAAPDLFADELDRALMALGETPTLGVTYHAGTGSVRRLLLRRTHQAYPLLLDATGFTVGGWEGAGTTSDFALWRYGLSAAPVSTFGTGGKVTTLLAASREAHATTMARQSTQKILLAGHVYDTSASSYDAAIVRYTTAGVLDTTFGTSGIALTGQTGTAAVTSIAVQPDDRIVAAGYTSPSTNTQLTVWRLTADGALDSTFATGGKAVFSFTALGGRATGVALQSDGRIVVTGSVSGLGTSNMAVFRLLPDGTVDGDFNGGPIISSSALVDSADAVAIQPDGAIVVAGTSNYGQLTLWRYR